MFKELLLQPIHLWFFFLLHLFQVQSNIIVLVPTQDTFYETFT